MNIENLYIPLIIVCIAAVFQLYFFFKTRSLRERLKDAFPDRSKKDSYPLYVSNDEDGLYPQIAESEEQSGVFETIRTSINTYLKENRGAADYDVLKDITDRNIDSIENQIDAISPIPIYIGLCGTLVGIVMGVGNLVFGDGLINLFNTELEAVESSQGIINLLQGVAVAMITTFFGVLLTIIASTRTKTVAEEMEEEKNMFLSWMQARLLPKMNDNVVKTLDTLQQRLTEFNQSFGENTRHLGTVFRNIKESSEKQERVFQLIDDLNVEDIATANVKVLRELQACTNEINDLHDFLNQSNQYLTSIQSLNSNLSDQYERTQLIESMGKFFKDEIEQIGQRKDMISKAVDKIDSVMQSSIAGLEEHSGDHYANLQKASDKQYATFLEGVKTQQEQLRAKLSETAALLDELHQLVPVKESLATLNERIGNLVDKTETQNTKIEKLTDVKDANDRQKKAIDSLLDRMSTLMTTLNNRNEPTLFSGTGETNIIRERVKIPVFYTILGVVTCVAVLATCVIVIVKVL